MKTLDVGILAYDDMDLLDATGPVEVFNAVKETVSEPKPTNIKNLYQGREKFRTDYISLEDKDTISTADGTLIKPDKILSEISDVSNYQIYVIPGGKGAQRIRKNKEIISWITSAIDAAHLSLSVCTGAYICAETGFLDNDIITTHWRHLDLFQEEFPHIQLANNARYMHGYKVITSGGVTAGIDGALYIVKNVISPEAARDAAHLINYPWLE